MAGYTLEGKVRRGIKVIGYVISDGAKHMQVDREMMAFLVGRGLVNNVAAQLYNGEVLFRGVNGFNMASIRTIQDENTPTSVDADEGFKEVSSETMTKPQDTKQITLIGRSASKPEEEFVIDGEAGPTLASYATRKDLEDLAVKDAITNVSAADHSGRIILRGKNGTSMSRLGLYEVDANQKAKLVMSAEEYAAKKKGTSVKSEKVDDAKNQKEDYWYLEANEVIIDENGRKILTGRVYMTDNSGHEYLIHPLGLLNFLTHRHVLMDRPNSEFSDEVIKPIAFDNGDEYGKDRYGIVRDGHGFDDDDGNSSWKFGIAPYKDADTSEGELAGWFNVAYSEEHGMVIPAGGISAKQFPEKINENIHNLEAALMEHGPNIIGISSKMFTDRNINNSGYMSKGSTIKIEGRVVGHSSLDSPAGREYAVSGIHSDGTLVIKTEEDIIRYYCFGTLENNLIIGVNKYGKIGPRYYISEIDGSIYGNLPRYIFSSKVGLKLDPHTDFYKILGQEKVGDVATNKVVWQGKDGSSGVWTEEEMKRAIANRQVDGATVFGYHHGEMMIDIPGMSQSVDRMPAVQSLRFKAGDTISGKVNSDYKLFGTVVKRDKIKYVVSMPLKEAIGESFIVRTDGSAHNNFNYADANPSVAAAIDKVVSKWGDIALNGVALTASELQGWMLNKKINGESVQIIAGDNGALTVTGRYNTPGAYPEYEEIKTGDARIEELAHDLMEVAYQMTHTEYTFEIDNLDSLGFYYNVYVPKAGAKARKANITNSDVETFLGYETIDDRKTGRYVIQSADGQKSSVSMTELMSRAKSNKVSNAGVINKNGKEVIQLKGVDPRNMPAIEMGGGTAGSDDDFFVGE